MTDNVQSDEREAGEICVDPVQPRIVHFKLQAPHPGAPSSGQGQGMDGAGTADAQSVGGSVDAPTPVRPALLPDTGSAPELSAASALLSDEPESPFAIRFATLISLVWTSVGAWWGSGVFGPVPDLGRLPPIEVAALSAVYVLPLMFLWLLVAFFRRGAQIHREAQVLRAQLALLTYPADHAKNQVATVAGALRAQAIELSEATYAAASQASVLRDILGRETRELAHMIQDVDTRTTPALERAASQVRQVSELVEKVRDVTATLDSSLSHHYASLTEAARQADTSAEGLAASLGRQCEQLAVLGTDLAERNRVVDDLVTRQDALLASAKVSADTFNHAATTLMVGAAKATHGLTKRAEAIDNVILTMTERARSLADATAVVIQQMNELGDGVDRRADVLHNRQQDITRSAHAAAQELDAAAATAIGDFNAFRDVTTDALEGAHAAAAAIRDTAAHAEGVRRLLHNQAKGLEDAARRMGEEVRNTGVACDEQGQMVSQATDRATERIRHLADLLSRSAVDITRTTARSVVEIETVTESMKQSGGAAIDASREIQEATRAVAAESDHAVSRVRAATDGMASGVSALAAAGQAFGDEAARIGEAANATIVTIRTLAADLSAETRRFGETADGALLRADAVRGALAAALASFEATIDGGVERVETAGVRLTSGANDFAVSARTTMETLNGAGGTLRAQVDALSRATDEAADRLQGVTRSLGESGDIVARISATVTEKASRAGDEFARRASALAAAAEEAKERASELMVVRQDVDVQRFLTETSYVIERLQATAVDITRLFTPSVEEDLWKRFYKGEQNVFLHHAARTITRSQVQAIKKLYSENREFRQYASRYVTEFESLLKGARSNDRGDVLTAVFTSSDMGRLYIVLARAIGRIGGD
ncbi:MULTISPECIES: hypothetical protein [unclassified Haematospirillum]|uniref:hypothetical protein n=1 Tax=unclassified Haematospirillum TaxID=2622088 RepID=UPI001438817C|nr:MULTISPECIES: hypothetical protein [unclassified Haematospirillum]NKD55480.1 hypothetical protein [Haematospirillum sp. H4890]NKD75620.1 hypothetical protein [Haematospirillum sp. H4485]